MRNIPTVRHFGSAPIRPNRPAIHDPFQALLARPQYRVGRWALPVICLAQFMVVLDVAIVNIAIPSIQHDLEFSNSELAWVVDAYTLAFGALLLLGGRMADLVGRRRMFALGIAVFTAGSLLGGAAATPGVLLSGRVLQGMGAAFASPAALSLVTVLFEAGPRRQRAMTVYAAMAGLGAIGGELLGGVFTEFGSWRWVLFVNVPIGMLLLVLTPIVLPVVPKSVARGLDVPGAITGTAALVCLVYGAIRAGTDGWTDPTTLMLLVGSAGLTVFFVAVEWNGRQPILPLGLLRDRARLSAIGTMVAAYGCLYPILFFGTRMMQDVSGFDALETGLAFAPCGVSMLLAAGVAKKLVLRIGPRPLMAMGSGLYLITSIWLATHVRSGYLTLLPALVLLGFAVSFATVGITLAAVEQVTPEVSGVLSGVLGAAQQVGGTLGVAVLASVAARATSDRLASMPSAGPTDALAHGFGTAFAFSAGIAVIAAGLTVLGWRRSAEQAPTTS